MSWRLCMILLTTPFTLFTTVSCCIRPDFPSPNDSKLQILSTKLNIIFWVLLCPEVVLLWAVRQWFEAGIVAKQFRDRGWTRRHGLFLLMGGFVLCNKDGQPIKTLSFPHFQRLVYEKVIDLPHLTSLEIQERSNLHPVLAVVAFLQATWFVAQCLVRFINASATVPGLPVITQFEAITAPLVIANWCIFIFAWKKPLDAGRPILIKPNDVSERERPRRRGITVTETFERERGIFQSIERRFQLECPQSQSTSITKSIFRLRLTWRTVVSILLWPIQSICEDLNQLIPSFTYDSLEFSEGTLKVPLFYVHTTVLLTILLLLVTVLGMGVSTVSFLFLLRSGSTLPFSSEEAKLVWRIASITSISFSAVALGLAFLATFLGFLYNLPFCACFEMRGLATFFLFIWYRMFLIGFTPFFIARVVLVVSSVICLRSVPGDVSMSQSWVDYIPHFS